LENKKWKRTLFLTAVALWIAGCGVSGTTSETESDEASSDAVEAVAAEALSEESGEAKPDEETTGNGDAEVSEETEDDGAAEAVDYDLTQMGADMVYATVYQFVTNPDDYIGKTVRMCGTYNAVYYEPTGQYYHCCIITDALACCAQGLEFVWGDGTHVYPDEYPENGDTIVVTGVYETYTEENDGNVYCRLNNATLEVE